MNSNAIRYAIYLALWRYSKKVSNVTTNVVSNVTTKAVTFTTCSSSRNRKSSQVPQCYNCLHELLTEFYVSISYKFIDDCCEN